MTQRTSRFSVSLSYDEAKVFYAGSKNRVQVTALDGKTINLPWSVLQPFFSTSGVQGHFVITYDTHGKLVSISRDD
jgi:uncharacterized membrane protein affecting hemolysin expression